MHRLSDTVILRQSINKKIEWFSEQGKKASTDNVAREMLREAKRWLCCNDLFYLAKLTGNDKIVQWRKFYEPFCDEVSLQTWRVKDLGLCKDTGYLMPIDKVTTDWKKDLGFLKRLFLCYRQYYKTTIVSKLHSLQLMLNFPNIHFVLCHNKEINASDNLMGVKNWFKTTELKKLFPECIPEGKDWGNATGFSTLTRMDWGRSEDTIEAVGVETEVIGRHWMLAKKNDLVTEKSVYTDEQIHKVDKWDDLFNIGLFDDFQVPLQDYEGTRYHFADLYSKLKGDPTIKLIEIPIVKDIDKFKQGDDSQITHPERYERVEIERMMQKNIWVFNCQLMLNPDDPARMQFAKEMIQTYQVIPDQCAYYLVVDPASARKKRSDYTVMLVVAVVKKDDKEKKFIVDGIRDKIDANQRIIEAIELVKRWGIRDIGWEAIGFQETDCQNFEKARRKEGLRCKVIEIKCHTQGKEDRIRGLVPEYANGEWYWPEPDKIVKRSRFTGKNYDLALELEEELLNFPLGEHDDLIDAQTFLSRMDIRKPVYKIKEEKSDGLTFADYHKMSEESIKLRHRQARRVKFNQYV